MSDIDRFIAISGDRFTSLPLHHAEPKQQNLPAIALGTVVATATYLIAPEAGIPQEGVQDESIAAAAGLFTYFVGSMIPARLCSTKREQRQVEKWNILKGVGTGAAGGLTLAIGLKLIADLLATGGIITGLAVAGGAGTWIYNKLSKTKYCSFCRRRDSCNHIVCRHCYMLHVPMEDPINCDRTFALTWHAIASQFCHDGLNYSETLALARSKFGEWKIYKDKLGVVTAVDCEQFRAWREKNRLAIMSFRGAVPEAPAEDFSHIREIERRSGYSR